MKTNFKFSSLLGTVYSRGNLVFTADGTSLFSPVGNRVTVFDLVNNKSFTLPFAHRQNISRLALHKTGKLLLSVDEDGQAILTNVTRGVVLHHFSLKEAVTALSFSPCGRYFAVGLGRQVQIWRTPQDAGESGELDYAPFVRYRTLVGHFDAVQGVEWSSDSRFLLSSSLDLTARIWSLDPEEGFTPTTLAGHRQAVVGAWFSDDQEKIFTVAQDGALFHWEYMAKSSAKQPNGDGPPDEEDLRWRIAERHLFGQNARVTCAAYHPKSNLLITGFSNGVFGLYEMPEMSMIQSLSITQNDITNVTISPSGAWLALGSSAHGQLLVWDWQSESYILKQQSHTDLLNSLVYSPDSTRVITASDDGKIKIWDTASGFCTVTFTEHTSAVSACAFASRRPTVLFSASLDGSVRAWDLIRYRNFRTFTATSRLSFSSIAVDPSGEVVAAASHDSPAIHVWSVQTGQLLDQLTAHEGPVADLAFSPDGSTLASGSWDHTVRLWTVFARTQTSELLQLTSDVLALTFRPDGAHLAISTIDGGISIWDVANGNQVATIDGRRDISGGRALGSARTAANDPASKHFTSLAYSPDGTIVLAAGRSKHICLYSASTSAPSVLLAKYTVSINLALSGTQTFLNSSHLTAAGPRELLDTAGESTDLATRLQSALPGSKRGDAAARSLTRPEIRVAGVRFAPTGRAFCAATIEGLLLYSLDGSAGVGAFDPLNLTTEATPAAALSALADEDYVVALVLALRLNEPALVRRVLHGVPADEAPRVLRELPRMYAAPVLRLLATELESGRRVEFALLWVRAAVSVWGRWIREEGKAGGLGPEIRALMRAVSGVGELVGTVARENGRKLDFLLATPVTSTVDDQI